jgi:hypothetical protein
LRGAATAGPAFFLQCAGLIRRTGSIADAVGLGAALEYVSQLGLLIIEQY